MEVSESLISKIHTSFADGLHFASPVSSLRTTEFELVRGVLQIFQGFSSSLFYWDHYGQCFRVKNGIYVTHLSQGSLHGILAQFLHAGTCLQLVEIRVNKIQKFAGSPTPTLRAFACSVSAWLRRLRDVALREEEKINSSGTKTIPTLLGLSSSLSSLSSGAEYLLQIVHGAIPGAIFEFDSSVSAADVATHILNQLYRNLNEVCLVQGGEEDALRMLLYIFTGTLFPYIEGLHSWLFEGTLDDPYEEMFFYMNKAISIDETEFWEKSYLLRSRTFQKSELDSPTTVLLAMKEKKDMTGSEAIAACSTKEKEGKDRDSEVCPMFLKDMAKAIVSAGKSLQLMRHAPMTSFSAVSTDNQNVGPHASGLTLSEAFCASLAALIGHSDHISEYVWQDNLIVSSFESPMGKQKEEGNGEILRDISHPDKVWCKFLADTLDQKRENGIESLHRDAAVLDLGQKKLSSDRVDDIPHVGAFCPQNPAMTVCQTYLHENNDAWNKLNLSRNLQLPPLNDEELRKAIFDENAESCFVSKSTHFSFGFQFSESELHRQEEDRKMLEMLFPFPTLLPSFEENLQMSEYLPFQKNSTLPSKILSWIQSLEPKGTSLPIVILQECLVAYVKKQADYIGRNILSKLLYDWRLLDELGVLRAIYLLGSGDLLHHFLAVIFNKLDKGESLDDEFELNTILQESIRNSADGTLLSTPDSLVVSITNGPGFREDGQPSTSILNSTPRKSRGQSVGIDVLESLKFTYRVSWPLELIANLEAIKKYNQVMIFLLKVKRAKYVLDKARRWMWKDRGMATTNRKRHWLLEQKLLHFVDAFHQYVMDRVYHSAWRELCDGVAAAGSLDEVIEVHESYLLSIQRLCFVVPDKLWALIASRLNTILSLALEFYSIQQTLSSGAVSAIKARCEMEVDRIERQFDECITFLLRILSFKLNVGQFPHLADLVTRINYNYFYMSDGGSLKNTSGSETIASKLGKAFQIFEVWCCTVDWLFFSILRHLVSRFSVLSVGDIKISYE